MATDLERFVRAEGRDELVKDVRRRIDAEGIQYIYYQFVSVTGRIMGKGAPARHWESMAEKGFQLVYGATANLFTDRHGNYIGYGPEALELVGIPEPETFMPLPWDAKTARVWCTCFRNREERDDPGAFLTSDCRANLKKTQADFEASTGLHLRAGTEPEMMWLKMGADGKPSVEGMTKPFCYHIDQFAELQPLIHKVVDYAGAMGMDMIHGDHEDAPGQLELNFQFDRAEKTADNLTTYRQICKQVGRELNVFPCFMPKPFMGVSGNGCHHNISLWRDDENVFMPEGDDLQKPSQLGLWAIGGIIEHVGALTVSRRADRELLPAALGHGLLGAGVRRLGLPEPHHGTAGVGARPVRVPLGRLRGQPVPVACRPDHGDVGRDRTQARPGRARGAQHLRRDGVRQGGHQDPDDLRRSPGCARARRGDPESASGRYVPCLHALQAGRVGALLRRGHRLGREGVPRRAPVRWDGRRGRTTPMCGIAGIIYRDGLEHDIGTEMTRMLQSMKHRGPDSTGYALYGLPSAGYVMRYKLADSNDVRDFEFEERLERNRREAEARMVRLGARIEAVESDTEYAFRVEFAYDGDLKRLADYIEDVPGAEVLSLGRSLEIVKDLGDAETVSGQYKLDNVNGTHAIGHVRMATESDVDISGAHPYWAYPFSDIAVVHNGQLTNYFYWRRRLERSGHRFQSECDSEIIAVYLAEKMQGDATLQEAMHDSLDELDGVFTYIAVTGDELGVAKDEMAAKPLVLYESDDLVALASEEIAIRQIVDHEIDTYDPYEREVLTWKR